VAPEAVGKNFAVTSGDTPVEEAVRGL
jgi:hypothetical protein